MPELPEVESIVRNLNQKNYSYKVLSSNSKSTLS